MALHSAARTGDLPELTRAITEGADVNGRDKLNRTPLHLAAWAGHAEAVKFLCEHHAAVNAAAHDDMVALHFACQKGHLAVVKALLAAKAKVNVRTRKAMTPLHFAATGGYANIVTALVRKGADTTATNKQEKSPLDLAKDEAVVEALHKADIPTPCWGPNGEEGGRPDKGSEGEDPTVENDSAGGRVAEGGNGERVTEAAPANENVKAAGESGRSSNLRKHRDEAEGDADLGQVQEGPGPQKKPKVNLAHFDADEEKT